MRAARARPVPHGLRLRRARFSTTPPDASASPALEATPLQRHLHRQIQFHGPLTTADYMRHCLTHPTHGYYTTQRVFGAPGDFTTSPELTPVFGELVAVWLAHHHHAAAHAPYRLVELGPGTGALLASALPALASLRASPTHVTLVEASARLRAAQAERLQGLHESVSWAASLTDALAQDGAPPRTLFVLHEFLDALPVHVFRRSPDGWRTQLVAAGPPRTGDAPLHLALARARTPADALLGTFPPPDAGDVHEASAELVAAVQRIARHVAAHGGAAVVVDYGRDGPTGDTLRAFERHRQVPLLHRPGLCDVTADVDFAQVRRAVELGSGGGAEMRGPVAQRDFLLAMGVAERFRRVAQGVVERGDRDGEDAQSVDAKLARLQADYDRLVDPVGMGGQYQVAVVCQAGAAPSAGGF